MLLRLSKFGLVNQIMRLIVKAFKYGQALDSKWTSLLFCGLIKQPERYEVVTLLIDSDTGMD